VKCQLDATRWFYWCILSSTCFGYIRPSSGALDVELQHMVFCTEFLEGWWSWEPLLISCVRCGWCRTAPSAPYTRWHFTLFQEEDARSNNSSTFLLISTCFRRLCAHHQEKKTVFLRHLHSTVHTRQSSTQNNKYQVSQKHSCFSWWWAHSHPKHIEIDKYTKNKFMRQVDFIYKIIQICTVNKTLNSTLIILRFSYVFVLFKWMQERIFLK